MFIASLVSPIFRLQWAKNRWFYFYSRARRRGGYIIYATMQETCLAICFMSGESQSQLWKDSLVPRLCERLGKISYDASGINDDLLRSTFDHILSMLCWPAYLQRGNKLELLICTWIWRLLLWRVDSICLYFEEACVARSSHTWSLFVAWHISQQPRLIEQRQRTPPPVYGSLIRTQPPPDILLSM